MMLMSDGRRQSAGWLTVREGKGRDGAEDDIIALHLASESSGYAYCGR